MYEINLVPDVKGELLKKQKMRNLIILACIVLSIACIVFLGILWGISSGQKLKIAGKQDEIKCRYDGTGKDCSKTGTAIMNFQNSEDILTIQKQMENVGRLNDEKVKLSRIFGVLDVILPDDGEDRVSLSELSVDLLNWGIFFNATAESNSGIHFRAVENFEKGIALSYYDYGNYMRKANEGEEGDSEGYVAIPSYCIDEVTIKGYVYGIYHKGMPYCEENIIADNNVVEEEGEKKDDEEEQVESLEYVDKVDEARQNLGDFESIYADDNVFYKVEDIYIRRTYRSIEDMENYREGKDPDIQGKVADINPVKPGYYFSSNCLQYNSEGTLDETATREVCPVLSSELVIGSLGAGRDSDGTLKMSFESNVPLSRDIFLARNAHMQIRSSTRQNVTDSYIQVRDMFSEELTPEGEIK